MNTNYHSALEELIRALDGLCIARDVPMRSHTSFRIGGPADIVLYPRKESDIQLAIAACDRFGIPYLVIGNGSNLLVSDDGIRGMVICISGSLDALTRDTENRITVGAGHSLTALSQKALSFGLMGLEWACGIPGSVGGACAMNAGAYGGEIRQILKSVRVLHDRAIKTHTVAEGDLGYRTSRFAAPDCIVLSATFELSPDDGSARERQNHYTQQRRQKQPLSYPSAGSVFKRPEGHFAGALIEQAGLKGLQIGGAKVSELHAGFIVNVGDATAQDVKRLIETIQREVYARFQVALECEIKMIG